MTEHKQKEHLAALLEMGEERARALLEEQCSSLREKLAATEARLKAAQAEAEAADERTRTAQRDADHARQQLHDQRIEAARIESRLRDELAVASASASASEAHAAGQVAELQVQVASARSEAQAARSESAARGAELEHARAEQASLAAAHALALKDVESQWQATLAEHKESFARSREAMLATTEQNRQDMLAACKEETAAYRRQVSALEKRVQEAEATAAGKEQECAELNEALEELEQEKRSEVVLHVLALHCDTHCTCTLTPCHLHLHQPSPSPQNLTRTCRCQSWNRCENASAAIPNSSTARSLARYGTVCLAESVDACSQRAPIRE